MLQNNSKGCFEITDHNCPSCFFVWVVLANSIATRCLPSFIKQFWNECFLTFAHLKMINMIYNFLVQSDLMFSRTQRKKNHQWDHWHFQKIKMKKDQPKCPCQSLLICFQESSGPRHRNPIHDLCGWPQRLTRGDTARWSHSGHKVCTKHTQTQSSRNQTHIYRPFSCFQLNMLSDHFP